MDLADKRVVHKLFGEGKIVRYSDSYIEIDFPSGNKEFVFPDAFGTFLTLKDRKAAKMVSKKKKKCEAEERELQKIRDEQRKKRQQQLAKARRIRRRRSQKIHPSSQSVFWCKEDEQDKIFEKWDIFTGKIKSGQNKGQPRRLARINKNSACLLTERMSGEPEEKRRILGLFMVDEAFDNKLSTDGYIPAHSEYRLQLAEEETEKMLFWNYYVNKRYPHKMTWNTGRHRYFDNIWMAQILQDIISLKKEEEKEHVKEIFEYFCRVNRIRKEDITEPNGALMRAI